MRQRLSPIAVLAIRMKAIRAARVLVELQHSLLLLALDADFRVHGLDRVSDDGWLADCYNENYCFNPPGHQ